MMKTLAISLLLSVASLPAHAAAWRCDYLHDGDIADFHIVDADSDEQARQRVLEWAAQTNLHIDRFLGCRAL